MLDRNWVKVTIHAVGYANGPVTVVWNNRQLDSLPRFYIQPNEFLHPDMGALGG
jgi:hypothetical protein